MKLKTLLKAHQKYSKTKSSLPLNFGDGYLLTHNPIYRNVRRLAIKAGFKFTSERFKDYDTLALTQLPHILSQKMIPYRDNVRPLLEIEKANPGIFEFSDIPAIQVNRVFHESSHAIAYSKIRTHFTESKTDSSRDRVLRLLLQESFANACESFSNLYATQALHDEFLHQNSYIMEEPRERAALRASVKLIGMTHTFELVLLSFLYANFISPNHGLKNFTRVLRFIFRSDLKRLDQLKKRDVAVLKNLFKIGFGLDTDFTIFTNGFIFRQMGLKQDLAVLLSFDFLSHLEEDERYSKCLSQLTGEVLE